MPTPDEAPRNAPSNGDLTITRTTSNVVDDYVTIYVRHDGEEVKVEVSLTDFALAITGMSRVPVTVERRVRRG